MPHSSQKMLSILLLWFYKWNQEWSESIVYTTFHIWIKTITPPVTRSKSTEGPELDRDSDSFHSDKEPKNLYIKKTLIPLTIGIKSIGSREAANVLFWLLPLVLKLCPFVLWLWFSFAELQIPEKWYNSNTLCLNPHWVFSLTLKETF